MAERTLLNYVEQVYDLEREQYTLTQMVNRLKQECSWKRNQLRDENANYSYTLNKKEEKSTAGSTAKIVFGVIIALGGLASASGIMVIYFIVAFFLIGVGIEDRICINKVKSENEKRCQEAIANEARHVAEVKQNNKNIKVILGQLEKSIAEFEKLLEEKSHALQYMYNYDIIHKSYRNFYGISKIYHLLDTGICDMLTGVNGAYSQMRTDQIIDNQKISIEIQKDLLATNQMMYSAINRTNDLLETMNQQINIQNASNTQLLQDIRNNTKISNFLIQSGNDDRKALAASAEYLAYAEKQKRLADGYFY